MRRLLPMILGLVCACGHALASTPDTESDSVKIYFRQSKIDFRPALHGNGEAISGFTERINEIMADSLKRFVGIAVTGAASPEGSIEFNRWLSEQRAATLSRVLAGRTSLPDSLITYNFLGRDWGGLLAMCEADPSIPYRDEVIALLTDINAELSGRVPDRGRHLRRLKALRGGVPYLYLYHHIFPDLRASRMNVEYRVVMEPHLISKAVAIPPSFVQLPAPPSLRPILPDLSLDGVATCRPFYMGIKTNLLYDAVVIPNIGVEFYVGRNWSVAAQWMYSWFKNDHTHYYWRIYGGDIEARRWFGRRAEEKPLSGHHVGVNAGIYTYDFEFGHRGYLAPKWTWAAGVSYGYSLALSRRFNLDFTVGIGYVSGTYKEYLPIDGHYVWQVTKKRNAVLPTKAEVSLVWLLGCDNYNRRHLRKGGRR